MNTIRWVVFPWLPMRRVIAWKSCFLLRLKTRWGKADSKLTLTINNFSMSDFQEPSNKLCIFRFRESSNLYRFFPISWLNDGHLNVSRPQRLSSTPPQQTSSRRGGNGQSHCHKGGQEGGNGLFFPYVIRLDLRPFERWSAEGRRPDSARLCPSPRLAVGTAS